MGVLWSCRECVSRALVFEVELFAVESCLVYFGGRDGTRDDGIFLGGRGGGWDACGVTQPAQGLVFQSSRQEVGGACEPRYRLLFCMRFGHMQTAFSSSRMLVQRQEAFPPLVPGSYSSKLQPSAHNSGLAIGAIQGIRRRHGRYLH